MILLCMRITFYIFFGVLYPKNFALSGNKQMLFKPLSGESYFQTLKISEILKITIRMNLGMIYYNSPKSSLFAKILDENRMQPKQPQFAYCSISTLCGIFSKRSLRDLPGDALSLSKCFWATLLCICPALGLRRDRFLLHNLGLDAAPIIATMKAPTT